MELTPGEMDQTRDVALANQILAHKQIVDAFGHASARSIDRPGYFLLAGNLAPSLVTPADILLFDPQSVCASDPDARVYLERFIHGEIYRARPDVHAIVHAHTPSVLPYAAVPGRTLRALCHVSGFIGTAMPVFDIRDHVAHSDMLIRTRALGAALACKLGDRTGILMRGHGFTVVGRSLQQSVYRAIYLELNARTQAVAEMLGDPVFLDEGEAAAADLANDGQLGRPWDIWAQEVRALPSRGPT